MTKKKKTNKPAPSCFRLDLSLFVSHDKARPNICKPWSSGDYSYATDGLILVRVARQEQIAERKDAPSDSICESILLGNVTHETRFSAMKEMPEDAPILKVGNRYLNPVLVERIAGLPGFKLTEHQPKMSEAGACNTPFQFVFQGGIGSVMPMRKNNPALMCLEWERKS